MFYIIQFYNRGYNNFVKHELKGVLKYISEKFGPPPPHRPLQNVTDRDQRSP